MGGCDLVYDLMRFKTLFMPVKGSLGYYSICFEIKLIDGGSSDHW